MSEKKPDGYIGYKPPIGWLRYSFSRTQNGTLEDLRAAGDNDAEIKPVYLSDHPPVPRELLIDVIKRFRSRPSAGSDVLADTLEKFLPEKREG